MEKLTLSCISASEAVTGRLAGALHLGVATCFYEQLEQYLRRVRCIAMAGWLSIHSTLDMAKSVANCSWQYTGMGFHTSACGDILHFSWWRVR